MEGLGAMPAGGAGIRSTWRSVFGALRIERERAIDLSKRCKATLLHNECSIRPPVKQEHVVVPVANAGAARAHKHSSQQLILRRRIGDNGENSLWPKSGEAGRQALRNAFYECSFVRGPRFDELGPRGSTYQSNRGYRKVR